MKVMFRLLPVGLAIVAAGTAVRLPAQESIPAAGAQVFAACRSCHTVAAGERSGIGPNLHGLFERQSGSLPGYNYTPALKAAGIHWDEKTLDTFLSGPSKVVPGTRMVMRVDDPVRRAALIAYLKSEASR